MKKINKQILRKLILQEIRSLNESRREEGLIRRALEAEEMKLVSVSGRKFRIEVEDEEGMGPITIANVEIL